MHRDELSVRKRRFIRGLGLLGAGLLGLVAPPPARAAPAGEIHRVTTENTASLRDAQHRSELRITVWYPAADAVESPLVIGPPGRPLFDVGSVAPNAAFAGDGAQRPVILLSHGFGGTARIMGWFGIPLARSGYVVIAVDHPGNNSVDEMTVAGARLWWDRAEDLRSALDAIGRDPAIGPHMDWGRVGVAGFSAGGFTALVAAGARVEPPRLARFCDENPDDGICRPQLEFAIAPEDYAKNLAVPDVAAETARAGDDHAIPQIRAAFAMAPALVQALDPASLARLSTPVHIVLGDADTVAPPTTNGIVAGAAIPNAEVDRLPGVGHYDFLASCTDAARAIIPQCKAAVAQAEAHHRAITAAEAFFGQYLSPAR
jgi:predicted dienelactone hydrolase